MLQRDHWRFGMLAREAVRNVFGAGSHMRAVLALAVVAGAGSSAYLGVGVASMRENVVDLAAKGRNVVVLSALDNNAPAAILRSSCEALAGERGIRYAGILEPAGELDVLPVGTRLPAQRASITLFPELADADLLIGPKLSQGALFPFYVWVGPELATAVYAGSHPSDLGTGYSITLPPRPSDTTSEKCVVVLNEFSDVSAALPAVASQLSVSMNAISGAELFTASSDPAIDYLQRPDRGLPLLLGLLGAIATAISTRMRASEIAAYRMSGTAPLAVMKLLTLESLLITGTATLSATAASLVMSSYFLDPSVPILWGLALAGTWAVAALAASLDLAIRRPSELAKDR